MLVSIVIPCYNSERTIAELVELCMEEFDKLDGYECEMILVNDYSKDKTYDEIKKLAEKHPNVMGINLAKNFGQHAAIMAGLQYVHGELVIGMDDDMQHHPSQIPLFLEKADEGYDVVFGVFKKRMFSKMKNFLTSVNHFLLWHLLERPKGIEMSSFWLARRYVIDRIREYTGTSTFVQLLFFRTTHNIADIDIEHFKREYGSSNYTFKKGFKLFLSFMSYSTIPLRFATFLGAVCFVGGIVSALVVLIRKLLNPSIAVGWSSLMCVILVLFGIVFLLLGILGEYIGKLMMTSSKTPQYVIRESVNTDNISDVESLSEGRANGKDT